MTHLTDEEIQTCADEGLPDGDSFAQAHLQMCELCQKAVKEYQILCACLAQGEGFAIPPDLARSVVSRIGIQPSPKAQLIPTDILVAVAGIIVALGTALYYLDLRPVANALMRIHLPVIEYVQRPLVSLRSLLAGLNHNLNFIAFAGLILVFIAALDHLICRKRTAFR